MSRIGFLQKYHDPEIMAHYVSVITLQDDDEAFIIDRCIITHHPLNQHLFLLEEDRDNLFQ